MKKNNYSRYLKTLLLRFNGIYDVFSADSIELILYLDSKFAINRARLFQFMIQCEFKDRRCHSEQATAIIEDLAVIYSLSYSAIRNYVYRM